MGDRLAPGRSKHSMLASLDSNARRLAKQSRDANPAGFLAAARAAVAQGEGRSAPEDGTGPAECGRRRGVRV